MESIHLGQDTSQCHPEPLCIIELPQDIAKDTKEWLLQLIEVFKVNAYIALGWPIAEQLL